MCVCVGCGEIQFCRLRLEQASPTRLYQEHIPVDVFTALVTVTQHIVAYE